MIEDPICFLFFALLLCDNDFDHPPTSELLLRLRLLRTPPKTTLTPTSFMKTPAPKRLFLRRPPPCGGAARGSSDARRVGGMVLAQLPLQQHVVVARMILLTLPDYTESACTLAKIIRGPASVTPLELPYQKLSRGI